MRMTKHREEEERPTHPRCEEEVEVLVEEDLVLGVSPTEALQEAVSQVHDLVHLLVSLWKCIESASTSMANTSRANTTQLTITQLSAA